MYEFYLIVLRVSIFCINFPSNYASRQPQVLLPTSLPLRNHVQLVDLQQILALKSP